MSISSIPVFASSFYSSRVADKKEEIQDRVINRLDSMALPDLSHIPIYDPLSDRINDKLENGEDLSFFERIMSVLLNIDTDEIGEGHF